MLISGFVVCMEAENLGLSFVFFVFLLVTKMLNDIRADPSTETSVFVEDLNNVWIFFFPFVVCSG